MLGNQQRLLEQQRVLVAPADVPGNAGDTRHQRRAVTRHCRQSVPQRIVSCTRFANWSSGSSAVLASIAVIGGDSLLGSHWLSASVGTSDTCLGCAPAALNSASMILSEACRRR